MKTTTKHPDPVSRTIQSKTKASNQAPIHQILQRYKAQTIQRQDLDEDELLQGKFDDTTQLMELDEDEEIPIQAPNRTGLPDDLKTGVENLSGYSMDDVRVHYNSSKPAQLQALAYTQGSDIHVAPGQEKHLPHEAWHVIQQKQGRVQPTMQLQGVNVNDNEGLEREADVMGGRFNDKYAFTNYLDKNAPRKSVIQCIVTEEQIKARSYNIFVERVIRKAKEKPNKELEEQDYWQAKKIYGQETDEETIRKEAYNIFVERVVKEAKEKPNKELEEQDYLQAEKELRIEILLKKIYNTEFIPSEYSRKVLALLKDIQEVDLNILVATTYEMMDNEAYDISTERKKEEAITERAYNIFVKRVVREAKEKPNKELEEQDYWQAKEKYGQETDEETIRKEAYNIFVERVVREAKEKSNKELEEHDYLQAEKEHEETIRKEAYDIFVERVVREAKEKPNKELEKQDYLQAKEKYGQETDEETIRKEAYNIFVERVVKEAKEKPNKELEEQDYLQAENRILNKYNHEIILKEKLKYINMQIETIHKNQNKDNPYLHELSEQKKLLEYYISKQKYKFNPNVLLNPEKDSMTGYMAILSPSEKFKDITNDDQNNIKISGTNLQIGFNTPVRSFSWISLYLLRNDRNNIPATFPLIRSFTIGSHDFEEMSQTMIQEEDRIGEKSPPNSEDLKYPNQIGISPENLKKYSPQNLQTFFSEKDLGAYFLHSQKNESINKLKERIGFGRYMENEFIPSNIHMFDSSHTAFHHQKDEAWHANSFLRSLCQMLIYSTFFDEISHHLQTEELNEWPEIMIPAEITRRVSKNTLSEIKLPKSISEMLKEMLSVNMLNLSDYKYNIKEGPDRRNNTKMSQEDEDCFAIETIAAMGSGDYDFTALNFFDENMKAYSILELKDQFFKLHNAEDKKEDALTTANKIIALLKENDTREAAEIMQDEYLLGIIALLLKKNDPRKEQELKKAIGNIKVKSKSKFSIKNYQNIISDITLQNTFFIIKQDIDRLPETNDTCKKNKDYFNNIKSLSDFFCSAHAIKCLEGILSAKIKNSSLQETIINLKIHALSFLFRLLRILQKANLLKNSDPQNKQIKEANIKVIREKYDNPFMRLNPETRILNKDEFSFHIPFDRNRSDVSYNRPKKVESIYRNTSTPFIGGISGTTRDISTDIIGIYKPNEDEDEKKYWKFQLSNAAFMIINKFHSFFEVIYPAAILGSIYFSSDKKKRFISKEIKEYIENDEYTKKTHKENIQEIKSLINKA